jgi:predicted glycosyltransferase
MLRVPAITMADYEYQPANHLSFRLARTVVLPDAIPLNAVRGFGVTSAKLVSYPGFKEDVTLSSFTPDPGFRASLGVSDTTPLVVLRPPPEGALYHRKGNPGFRALLPMLASTGAEILVTPRTQSQGEELAREPRIRVLRETVSGADLLWQADLVIGAGGTMTREAAVLGTPSITIFSGRLAAVDEALIRSGRLRHVAHVGELAGLTVDRLPERTWMGDGSAARSMAGLLEEAFGRVARRRPARMARSGKNRQEG